MLKILSTQAFRSKEASLNARKRKLHFRFYWVSSWEVLVNAAPPTPSSILTVLIEFYLKWTCSLFLYFLSLYLSSRYFCHLVIEGGDNNNALEVQDQSLTKIEWLALKGQSFIYKQIKSLGTVHTILIISERIHLVQYDNDR